ncbi:MAG: hypothetical protein PVJ21_06010 [Anaerolineales bacterium]|jgi:hypothetical protein
MSNQMRIKLPIVAKIHVALFWGIVMFFLFACALKPAPNPSWDSSEIATYAFETAQVLNAQTRAAGSLAMEPTLPPTETQVSLSTPTNTHPPPPTATENFIPVTGGDCIPNNPPQTGRVVDVVDGDTIKVLLDEDGKTYSGL